MPGNWQQAVASRENCKVHMRIHTTRRVAPSVAAAVALALSMSGGCDCAPARSKPWRVAPDPAVEAERQPSSEIVASEALRVETRKHRAHTLRIHMRREPRHLNPLVSPSVWTVRVARDTIFETLVRYQPPDGGSGTGPGSYRPGLARSWRISANGREIKLELEPDVAFHDGRRLTSVDVQFSLDAARNPRVNASHLRALLADVTAVELVTARSLRIRLSRPNGYIVRALAEIPILPSHVYRNKLTAQRGAVVGSGPYRLASWRGDVVHLTRFAEYWGQKPAVPDIEFSFEPDSAKALTAAKRGELDLIPELISEHYPEQASAPGIVSSFTALRLRPTRLSYLLMDAGGAPFDDVRVRRALVHLIDRKGVVREVMDGLARLVAGPVWPGGPGDGAAPPAPDFDPAVAADLLDQAGWRDRDKDGIRERDGKSLRLAMLVREDASEEQKTVRERVIRALRRSGILVEQRTGSAAVLMNRLRSGEFDLAFLDWRSSVDVDLSPLFETGGARNYGRFSDKRVDRALSELRAAGEPSSRAPLTGAFARLIAETWPIAPVVAPEPYGLLHRRVRGAVVWDGWLSLRDLSFVDEQSNGVRPTP